MGWREIAILAAAAAVGVALSSCAVVGPAISGAGGWWTHQRIEKLETDRVEVLEERVKRLEVR